MPHFKGGETEDQSNEGNCPTQKPMNLIQKSDSGGRLSHVGCWLVLPHCGTVPPVQSHRLKSFQETNSYLKLDT